MITIFDCINDILYTKKGKLIDNIDDESALNMYMINRWVSMYSPGLAMVINNTTNWMSSVFETKHDYYRFVSKVLPRVPRKRIHYIKKTKPETTEQTDNTALLAKRLELSEREIKSYYELHQCCTASTNDP